MQLMKTLKLFLLLLLASTGWSQFSSTASHIRPVATLPSTCRVTTGDVVFLTAGRIGVYQCTATNTWTFAPLANTTITTPAVDCLCAKAKDASTIYGGAVQQAYVPTGATGGTLYAATDTWTTTGGSCTTQPAGTLTSTAGVLATLTVTTKGVGCTTQPTLVPATTGSGAVVLFSACNNTSDAVGSITAFSTGLSIPAGTIAAGNRWHFTVDEAITNPASNSVAVSMSFRYNSTTLWRTVTATLAGGWAYNGFTQAFDATALSTTQMFASAIAVNPQTTTATSSSVVQPVTVNTASTASFTFGLQYASTGTASGTCNDAGNKCGLTVSGTVGQTCLLTAFNGTAGTGATATVYLTGTDLIANGTALYITNTGAAYTGASTTATGGNGTATCSGTATVATALGGSQGNAINLSVLTAVREN